MRISIRPSFFIWFLVSCLAIGCTSKKDNPDFITFDEADKRFAQYAKEDFKDPVIVRRLENTLWIYYPTDEDIISMDITKPSITFAEKESLILNPIDGFYENNSFHVEYVSMPGPLKIKFPGYRAGYSKAFQKLQQAFLTTIQRSYFNVDQNGEDAENIPKFIVLVIADIKTGIEFESTFFYNDLKLSLGVTPYITGEEYRRRTVSNSRGNKEIIGDISGKHLEFNEITMEHFLAKQIENRINLKFNYSDFSPSIDQVNDEIIRIIAKTLAIYDYQSYDSALILDLNNELPFKISKSDLQAHAPEDADLPPGGKLHVINFR